MSSVETEPALQIIREPKVYLVGRQMVDEEALAAFLADHDVNHWTTDTEVARREDRRDGRARLLHELRQAAAGRAISAYIGHILEVGHGSVLEHAVFNLLITGVSRSLTHELIRHRAGFGFSQLSQRFVDESEGRFVEPEAIAEDPELHRIWLDAVRSSQIRLSRAGRPARREVQGPRRPDPPPQEGTRGRPQRPAQRHRDQDLRHRQCPRLAQLHRDARRCRRRRRDPPPRPRRPRAPPARGAQPLRRLLARRPARGREGRDDASSQSVKVCKYKRLSRFSALKPKEFRAHGMSLNASIP